MTVTRRLAVFGAGSWGTALAILAARHGTPTILWGRDREQMAEMAAQRLNRRYLPEVLLPPGLAPESDFEATLRQADDFLLAVPSHAFRATLRQMAPALRPDSRIAWATKGLEPGTRRLLHEVVAEELGADRPVAVISGPTFAREVAKGLPTAMTVASSHGPTADHFAALLRDGTVRAYTSDDIIGVELGGAVKNVLALAAGIADGLGYGANTRAALITRGLAEMMRLGVALGGHPETFMGLTGLGDLILTCTDDQSRNRRVGLALGRGASVEEAIAAVGQAVEGVKTAPEILRLAQDTGVEMPIVEQVCRVLFGGVAPEEAVKALLGRDPKPERH